MRAVVGAAAAGSGGPLLPLGLRVVRDVRAVRVGARRRVRPSWMRVCGFGFGFFVLFPSRTVPLPYLCSSPAQTIHRLLYRSRQRGFLELDLLVGSWAEEHVNEMSPKELTELELVLDAENPDLFSWLTGQTPPAEAIADNSVYLRLREHVAAAMDRMPEHCKAAKGSIWVRGWNDKGGEVAPGLGLAGGDGWPTQDSK